MKKFLSDYGFTILAAIVVITLIMFSSPISSAIQKQTANTVQSLGKVTNNDLNKIDNSVSLIDLTNINKSGVVGDFSRKGNLVTINGTQYRVLDVNGTQVKVMSIVNIGSSTFNSSSVTTLFGSYVGQKYADSTLDQAMTTYYNGLPEAIQNAIVQQNINQTIHFLSFDVPVEKIATSVTSRGYDYIVEKKGEINVGNRKVYALDVDDVFEYLGPGFTWKQLNKMVFDTENTISRSAWLRSARSSDGGTGAFRLGGSEGSLAADDCRGSIEVHPAFVIDLSLLS